VAQNAADVFAELLKSTAHQQDFAKLSLKFISKIAEGQNAKEQLNKQTQEQTLAQTEAQEEDDFDDQDVQPAEDDDKEAERSDEEPKDKSLKKSRQQEANTEQTTRPNFV